MTSLLLTLVMLLSLVPAMGVTASAAASGNGTKGDPFVVNTYEDWKEKMELTGEKYIKLGADIDTSTMYGGYGLGSTDFVSAIGRSHLDLNGKKLTLKKSIIESGGKIQFISLTAGELIIDDSQGGGEIVGVNNVTRRYMRLIDVMDNAKLTLNSGNLHLKFNADADLNNTTIWSMGTVEINGGTVAISCPNTEDERGSNLYNQDYALSSSGKAVINGGTLDGRVLLKAVAKGSGVADNVITGGDFKKSIYIHKDKGVTGDVPLNVSIQGGTYHYTPGYYTHPVDAPAYPGKKSSDPSELFQFATGDFREKDVPHDGAVYPAFPGESSNSNYDMNAFASMFHKNAIITAEGQEYDYYDVREDRPMHIVVNDAAFTGSSTPLDLAHLVNSHYKTITVTTLPEDALKDMKLTVGDGAPLPAQGDSTVSGDVALGSDGTLTKNVYITAIGNKQLKEMYYSDPSKIDFGYRLNIFKDGKRVDYTGAISQTYTTTTSGDEISVGVQLPNFKFEEGVYTFRLALWPYLRGSEAQIGETLVGRWNLTAKGITEISSAPVRLSAALTSDGSAPGATAVGSGYTVDSIRWYTDSACNNSASSFVAGTDYYGKIVLKPEKNYKFAASASALFFCDDPNENYSIVGSSTVAEDGSSLTLVVKGTAVSALVWESVDKANQTYTIGDSALTLNAKATGGESSKPISYKLIAKKGGTETVKASAMVAASATDSFSASLRLFTETGSYECWFEATRGNVTITSDHFTVTVNAPGLSITNQSGDLTVKQNANARLFVKAKGHGVNYQWQVKNGETWDDISSATDYDYAASTTTAGEETYRCVVTDKYGAIQNSNEMKVTVKEVADTNLTPAIPLAAVNGDAPDPAEKWPHKSVPASGWLGLEAEYDVTAGEIFQGVATFSTIPAGEGYHINGNPATQDIYYDSYNDIQKTPVLGDISYEWKAAATEPWLAAGGAIAVLSTEKSANITIPSGVTTYYAQLKVMNTVGTDTQTSTVYITFHVSAAHTAHSYAYAQLDDNQHTKYCTACADSSKENHDMDNGVCKYCGYAPATYTVSVTNGTADHNTNVAPGTKVTLTANTAPSGQEFDNWVGNVTVASDNTFNMPSHNVTVAATYKPKAHAHDTGLQAWTSLNASEHYRNCSAGDDPQFAVHTWQWVVDTHATSTTAGSKHEECPDCHARRSENTVIPATGGGSSSGGGGGGGGSYTPSYTVSVDKTENGTITVSPKSASKGDTVTITVKPDKGYELEMLKALDKDGDALKLTEKNGKYTFTMPSGKVTIKGSFVEEAPVQIFKDVPVDAYYYEAVKWAAEKGITGGVGNGLFAPNQPCTRAQIVTFLWRAAGSPAPKNMSSFADVPADAFYAKAVAWAVENGITGGTGDGKFSPDATCTRAQSVTFLYRAAGSPKVSSSAEFGDVATNAYYADAVAWAAKNGITGGIGGGLFGSGNDCTRAQIVTFLYRSVK